MAQLIGHPPQCLCYSKPQLDLNLLKLRTVDPTWLDQQWNLFLEMVDKMRKSLIGGFAKYSNGVRWTKRILWRIFSVIISEIGRNLAWHGADLPLILILSVYTDFLTFKFGKIQIFSTKIKRNTDFWWTAKGFSLYFPYSY